MPPLCIAGAVDGNGQADVTVVVGEVVIDADVLQQAPISEARAKPSLSWTS